MEWALLETLLKTRLDPGPAGSTLGCYRILFEVVRRFEIKTVIETGTHFGVSSLVMALAKPDLTIVTIDVQMHPVAREQCALFGVEERIEFLNGDSHLVLPKLDPCDLLFLDSYHDDLNVLYELCAYPYEPKIIVVHDAYTAIGAIDVFTKSGWKRHETRIGSDSEDWWIDLVNTAYPDGSSDVFRSGQVVNSANPGIVILEKT